MLLGIEGLLPQYELESAGRGVGIAPRDVFVAPKDRELRSGGKVGVLKRRLVGKVPVSEPSDELGLNPTVFYDWQRLLVDKGAAAFQRRGRISRGTSEAGRIEKLEGNPAQKNEVLADRMQEHVEL